METAVASAAAGSSAISLSEHRRKREAMDALVLDVLRGNDENVASCLRIALERGWSSVLVESLKEAKKRKDVDIDKICARHYDEFLKSVRDMLEMRESSAVELTQLIREIHGSVRDTGKEMLVILRDLQTVTRERQQTRQILENVLEFKNIVILMNQVRLAIDRLDYYNAINILTHISKETAKIASIRPMMTTLTTWLPVVTAKLLTAIRFDCDTMISNNRYNHSLTLGKTILQKFAETSTAIDLSEVYIGKVHARSTQILADRTCSIPPSISLAYLLRHGSLLRLERWIKRGEFDASIPQHFIDLPSEEGLRYLMSISEAMPLAPLHKCLYAYRILGKIDQFFDVYRLNRDGVLPVLFEEAEVQASNQGLATVLPSVIAKLVGFFGMECLIRHTLDDGAGDAGAETSDGDDDFDLSNAHAHANSNDNSYPNGTNAADEAAEEDGLLLLPPSLSVTNEGAFGWIEIHTLWDKACGYLHGFISRHCDSVRFIDQILQIKEELLLLAETVTNDDLFGFRTHGLFESIRYLWTRFEKLQLEGFRADCKQALGGCAFQPFYIASEDVYRDTIFPFELEQYVSSGDDDDVSALGSSMGMDMGLGVKQGSSTLDELEEGMDLSLRSMRDHDDNRSSPQQYQQGDGGVGAFVPKTMPFSDAVPAILRSIHVMVTRYFVFVAKNPYLGSRGESICKTIQEAYALLGKILLKESLVLGAETPLSKACQVSIDAAVFAKSSVLTYRLLEALLKHFRWTESLDTHLPSCLQAIQKNISSIGLQAQDMVFELLSLKIDDLLGSLVFINFQPDYSSSLAAAGSSGNIISAHEPVEGIIDFLRITLMWLTHLPHSARETAHFTCFSKIASGLLEYILSPKVSAVNYICIACFAADARKLESFADECGIQHLRQKFSEFHELMKALLHPELATLIDNVAMRRTLFPRLDALKLCTLLDKIVPLPMGVPNVPGLPRPDKSTLKALVKKLKVQIAKS